MMMPDEPVEVKVNVTTSYELSGSLEFLDNDEDTLWCEAIIVSLRAFESGPAIEEADAIVLAYRARCEK